MNRTTLVAVGLLFATALSASVLTGACSSVTGQDGNAKDKGKAPQPLPDRGPHGGTLVEWDDDYCVELTVDHASKKVVVYILDYDAKAPPKVDVAKITNVRLFVTTPMPRFTLELQYDAKLSGARGCAFVGMHDAFAKPAEMKGAIDGRVNGKPYSGEFVIKDIKPKAGNLRDLYLKPGGIYTAADIKANGNTTAAEKYAGKLWDHDDAGKPGERICPVTNLKADAGCTWIINGQTYQFCCPPCIDVFIKIAHKEPSEIKPAKDYVKK